MDGGEEETLTTLSRSTIILLHVLAVLLGSLAWIALEVGGSLGGTFRYYFDTQLNFGLSSDRTLIDQLGTVVGVLIGGYAIGVFIMGFFVELLSKMTRVSAWIENNTKFGVVGIAGFLCFLLSVVLDVIDSNF